MLKLFKKKYSSDELKLIYFLSGVRQFEKLKHEELELFLPCMYLRTYNQNEVVFFSGDPSQALYVLKSGRVSLTIDIKDRFEELMMIRSGEAFGDNSLLNSSKRIYNSTVISEQAEIYVIPQIHMTEILDNNPEIRAKIMTTLAEMYNEYTEALFKLYRSSFGFFELGRIYENNR